MNFDAGSLFSVFSIEVFLAALAMLLIAVDLFTGRGRLTGQADAVRVTALLGLTALLVFAFTLKPQVGEVFGTLDSFAIYWKRFFLFTALGVVALSGPYENRLLAGRAEFPTLIVFTTMGACLLASVNDFVTLFVGLELVTVTLFLLVAWRSTLPSSIEAGIKYVIIGALAAAFMVYGIAWVYGTTGSFNFADVHAVLNSGAEVSAGLKLGLLLVLVGLGFKLGAVPFHVWVPDVYQGAPTPVTAFLSVGSKAAGVVLLMRLVYTVLGPAAAQWSALFAGLSALTLLMGNLGAIPQTDLKRFLGYSGISHAGFLLMALATHSIDSATGVLFYLGTYLFANLAAFLVIVVVSRTEDNASMDRVNGLADRSPFLAFVLTACLLSLAGVPPLAGFFAKWMILRAAMADPSLLWLVVLSCAMIVVSLYYYLCVIKRMYMRDAIDTSVLEVSGGTRWMLLASVGVLLVLGIWQQPLVGAAAQGARSLFP